MLCEEQLGLAAEAPGAGCRRSRETAAGSARRAARLRRCSHWLAKLVVSASARGIGEHAPHLRVRAPPARCSSSAFGRVQQLVVRDAAPEEERQARRQLDVADPIRRARRRGPRVALDAEQELRARQERAQRHLDARFEAAGLALARPSMLPSSHVAAACLAVELRAAPRGPRRSPAVDRRGAPRSR